MMPKRWQFKKREDGKIGVTLDNNVWDFLFSGNFDLALELPPDHFAVFITRQVEIETEAIPNTKTPLKEYISRPIEGCHMKTTSVFGFASEGTKKQRVGGFGQGVWQSQTETEFYEAIRMQYLANNKEMGSELFKNEGDAAVAAQSFFSIVLTRESPKNTGPLRFANENGGKVLYLRNFDPTTMTLRAFVENCHQQA
jgi:hypothetical protein